ncbi:hypothetical protein BC477_11610 [Clavibacter michiganensis subsp. michiganensis]|uniref:Uncharacterized protein n=1 Tax=Clavibacter michiganensis subsp. michiganensis TaxID=33013 RepID=A0A251XI25_CLAMM|nr:hypothetical protein BC477_11610 [Clavibacter michiganensis subsp. michiganensis]OUE02442.1 hypothetical protein CMMCAS07_10520 [Clavibacter michiganensis subsp. michiganensis]
MSAFSSAVSTRCTSASASCAHTLSAASMESRRPVWDTTRMCLGGPATSLTLL